MHRYFFYDQFDGFLLFPTVAERDAHARHALAAYRDAAQTDGWSEDAMVLCCGVVTHRAQEVNRVDRVGELDEDGLDDAGEYWADDDVTTVCDVEMLPLPEEG